MIHLRVVAPPDLADAVVESLVCSRGVVDIVHLPGVSWRPEGDLITCDVAREDASVVLDDLRALGIDKRGSITLEYVGGGQRQRGRRLRRVGHARRLRGASGSTSARSCWPACSPCRCSGGSSSAGWSTTARPKSVCAPRAARERRGRHSPAA